MRLRPTTAVVLFGLFLSPSVARAQITQLDETTMTPTEGVGNDYIEMQNETVDPSTGSVNFSVQAPMPKGRGVALPFSFTYSSQGVWHLMPTGNMYGGYFWTSNNQYLSQGGWSYSTPVLSWNVNQYQDDYGDICSWQNAFMFQDATGGRHSF